MVKVVLLVCIAPFLVHQNAALLSKGSIVLPPRKPVFLSKFCFDFAAHGGTTPGSIHMEFSDESQKTGTYDVVVFDDQAESFPDESAYHDWKCDSQRLAKASKFQRSINTSVPLWKTTMTIDERIRPRWWYVALLDCSGVERKIEYTLHMLNPRLGWRKEFSIDQCGPVSLGLFLLAYIVLACSQLWAITQTTSVAQSKHPLRLLLLSAISFAAFGLLAFALDAALFMRSGESIRRLHMFGKILKSFSKLIMTSMLLLLSQGICITQHFKFQDLGLLHMLAPFFAVCFAFETWGEYAQSRTYATGFVYCTWYGAGLVLGDLCLLGIYLVNLRGSYASSLDAEKRNFYLRWGTLYSSAFVALPFATVLSMIVAPWVRSEVMFILTNSVHILLLILLVIGLWPERMHTFFCIDQEVLAKTIGTTSSFLSQCDGDYSPCLLTRRPPSDYLKKGVSFDMEEGGTTMNES
jgi:hypothetical protein